jgi:hypothetical protein
MSATLSLERAQAGFERAAVLAVQHTERTYDKFVNGQSFALMLSALRNTEKAEANRIAFTLGQVATKVTIGKRGPNKGKLRKGANVYAADSLASRIINAKRRQQGLEMLFGKDLEKAVKRFIGARVRASAFIKSGWLPAIRGLASAVGKAGGVQKGDSARMTGAPKGFVIPARKAVSSVAVCEMGNTALLAESAERTGSRKGRPMPVAQRGLMIAYRAVERDILKHLAEKLGPEFRKFSA